MLGFFDISPYINKGNWGYEHQKSCKNATKADEDAPDTNTGKCTDCNTNCNATTLKLKDNLNPDAAGDAITLNNNADGSNKFTSNDAITITAKSKTVDFTQLDLSGESLTISISKGTIKNSSNNLQINSPLTANTVLSLDANGTITNPPVNAPVDLKGTIVVTTEGKLGNTLTFGGGPGGGVSGSLTLQSGANTITGNLTIPSAALTALKSATGTLNIGTASPTDVVKYKLVTKDTIILGLNTLSSINATNAKVTLNLPPTTIEITQSSGGISATLTDVTFSKDDGSFTNLKTTHELTLNSTITGAKITRADNQALTKDEQLNKGTVLNISGSSSNVTTKIDFSANIKVIKSGKLSGAATYNLTGGITGTLSNLKDSGGVQGALTITNISYDPNEFHDKHTTNGLCCYFGKFNLSKEYEYDSNWDGKPETTVYGYIWYFIDILLVIKISLAIIFKNSLHYRESDS